MGSDQEMDYPNWAFVQAAGAAQELKDADNGVGSDLTPFVEIHRDGRNVGRVLIGAPRQDAHEALATTVTLFAPDFVIVVAEAFALTQAEPDLAAVQNGPPLRERFAAGDPDVAECLEVTMFWPDDTALPGWFPYRYAGRRIEWLPVVSRTEMGVDMLFGPTPGAVGAGFATATVPAPMRSASRVLRRLGCEVVLANAPTRAGRNEPCGCGSGRKHKHCHGR